ncbi:hypothetical protein HYQ46_001561 [Verticillium longisporum]|nr:hypothetical protein HYQ46_001561 [Verticillium longisporum]
MPCLISTADCRHAHEDENIRRHATAKTIAVAHSPLDACIPLGTQAIREVCFPAKRFATSSLPDILGDTGRQVWIISVQFPAAKAAYRVS